MEGRGGKKQERRRRKIRYKSREAVGKLVGMCESLYRGGEINCTSGQKGGNGEEYERISLTFSL